MTSITRNLPLPLKRLGVALIGERCYRVLVENLDVADGFCLKYALSKGLGIGIVVGGSVMKVPQIFLILNAHSARGLSLPAYILETFSYAITLAYSVRNHYPFSTYGENVFLAVQNTIITFLIIACSPQRASPTPKIIAASVTTIVSTIALALVPGPILKLLQLGTIPLSLFSKLPQIRQNARARSTGQLSSVAIAAQVAGCLARLFTTATEVDDILVAAAFGLALLLNLVLAFQMYSYWGRGDVAQEKLQEEHIALTESEKGKARAYEHEPDPAITRVATPPIRSPNIAGRKWARKVV